VEAVDPLPAGEARLGPWRIRPSQILIRHGKTTAQQFFLFPPAGYVGRVRLAVIVEERRDEYVQAWIKPSPIPLLFVVHVSLETSDPTGRAYLLLESEPAADARADESAAAREATERARETAESAREAPERAPEAPLTGTLAFARAHPGARIYLTPLLAPPEETPVGRTADEAARLLKSALLGMEHGHKLRAAWAADWSAHIAAAGLAPRVHALAATGRLEFLATSECAPPTLGEFDLPAGVRTGWLVEGRAVLHPASPAAAITQLLMPESALPPLRALADSEPAGRTLANHPFHWIASGRRTIAHGYRLQPQLSDLLPADSAAAALHFDALVRASVRWRSQTEQRPGFQALAFCPLLASREADWRRAAGFVTRWNRRHVSPVLVPATPADYFALIEELEAHGAVHLSEAVAPWDA